MKIKEGFAKRNIAGSEIVVPVGKTTAQFNGMITLNGSGGFFWDCLKNDITEDEMLQMVLNEYDVDAETAKEDIKKFINMLRENNILES